MIRHEIKTHIEKMMKNPGACPVGIDPREARMSVFYKSRKVTFIPSGNGTVSRKPVTA